MTDPTQFIVDQAYIHKILTHEGLLGKGRDFLTDKECSLHLYNDKFKRTYVMQEFNGVDQQFVSNKLTKITKSAHSYFVPNTTKLCFVSTRKNTKGLFDICIFYDASGVYGYSLQYIIKMKIKNKQKFEDAEIIGFFWQIADFLQLSGKHTGQFLQITPVNVFCKPNEYMGYNFFPNNFGLNFEGTKWQRNYFNPEDKFWNGDKTLQSCMRAVMFIFGMVLLELCSLQSPSQLYENGKINEKLLSKRIEGIKITNDQLICGIIKNLLKVKEEERLKIDEIFKKQQYLKSRRIDFYKNKAGFYDYKTFQGVVEFDKKTAIGEGLDQNLALNRGKFEKGTLEGLGLRERKDNLIHIGVHEKGEITEGTEIKKNTYLRIGDFEKGSCKKGIEIALNIGLLNKDPNHIVAYQGQFVNGQRSKGKVYYFNGNDEII